MPQRSRSTQIMNILSFFIHNTDSPQVGVFYRLVKFTHIICYHLEMSRLPKVISLEILSWSTIHLNFKSLKAQIYLNLSAFWETWASVAFYTWFSKFEMCESSFIYVWASRHVFTQVNSVTNNRESCELL